MSEQITIVFESDLDKADFITRFGHLLHMTYRYECLIQKVAETPELVKVDHALLKADDETPNVPPTRTYTLKPKPCATCGNLFVPNHNRTANCPDCKAEQSKKAQSQQ